MFTNICKSLLCVNVSLLMTISTLPVMADNNNVGDIVTVSDQNPFQTVYHTDSFTTTLQATLSGTPTPETECKITTGPDYHWSSVNFPYQLSPNASTAQLIGTPQSPKGWTGATNGTDISVYVTWGDDHGNTYTSNPANYNVRFSTRSPNNVVINDHLVQRIGPNQSGIYEQPYWGHNAVYILQVMDNQFPQSGYDRGNLTEVLSNTQLNPQYASDLQADGVPIGESDLKGGDLSNEGLVTDDNSWNNADWKNPSPLDTGWDTLWFQTVQNLTVNEQLYNAPCNTAVGYFTLYIKQGDTLRQ